MDPEREKFEKYARSIGLDVVNFQRLDQASTTMSNFYAPAGVKVGRITGNRGHPGPLDEKFVGFTERLQVAKTYDEVLKICREIDSLKLEWFSDYRPELPEEESISLTFALMHCFKSSKEISFHRKVIKAMTKPAICSFAAQQMMDGLFLSATEPGNKSSERHTCRILWAYSWMSNWKLLDELLIPLNREANGLVSEQENQRALHLAFGYVSTWYSSYSNYTALAIETYILGIDDFKFVTQGDDPTEQLFELVLNNLENLHENVRKLSLELFRRMAKLYKPDHPDDIIMINLIMTMPWTNRNKYALLAIFISENHQAVIKHRNFELNTFVSGLQIALTMHNLLAPSQALVKAMMTKEVFKTKIIIVVAKLLWDGEDQIVENLLKFWFTTFEPTVVEKIYDLMSSSGLFKDVSTTSIKFYRLLVLRNAFKKTFKDPKLDEKVRVFAHEFDELPTKIEVFHILADKALEKDQKVEAILSLIAFLRYNIAMKESSFVEQHVMRKLPDLFNVLASKKFREVETALKIFGAIENDLYQYGMEFGSYETVAFSLKLLQVILKQYCGNSGEKLRKNTNTEGNLSFGKFLKENYIWDLTSPEIFKQLLKIMEGDDHNDLSDLAVKLLIEHFIKQPHFESVEIDHKSFFDWLGQKGAAFFKNREISSNVAATRYFMLRFECSLIDNSARAKLCSMITMMKEMFDEIKRQGDPVKSLEEGLQLFKAMDSINYGLKRMSAKEIGLSPLKTVSTYLKNITEHFLDFFSDKEGHPSFERMDQKVEELLDKTMVDNASELKSKLVLYIWYTLRSCAEISDTFSELTNATFEPNDNSYKSFMTNCIDINIQMLHRCCHKGVLDSSSEAIGKITKIISTEFMKLCDRTTKNFKALHEFLVILKKEIFASKRSVTKTGDIRSSRGLMVIAHEIIANHPRFLRFLIEFLITTTPIPDYGVDIYHDYRFKASVMPIQLHLLAALIKDSKLNEPMLEHIDKILMATLIAYHDSNDFVETNALLQLIGAIVPRIANQKRSILGDEDELPTIYEPKVVAVHEFFQKFPSTFMFIMEIFKRNNLKKTFSLVILELLSSFEHRPFEFPSPLEEALQQYHRSFQRLMGSEDEKTRILAARCSALYVPAEMLALSALEKSFSKYPAGEESNSQNSLHSLIYVTRFMIERYESSVKFIGGQKARDLRKENRDFIIKLFKANNLAVTTTFYLRYHFLEFLLFLGIPFKHEVCQSLMKEEEIKSTFGYKLWAEKVKELQMKHA